HSTAVGGEVTHAEELMLAAGGGSSTVCIIGPQPVKTDWPHAEREEYVIGPTRTGEMGEPASARRMAAYQLAIVAAACAIFFLPSLGWTGLWDMDEALYASCAREMFQRGNWIVPW